MIEEETEQDSAKNNRFDFLNSEGLTLSGRLDLPQGLPRAFAIFAHCFTCSKNVHAAYRISNALRQQGVAVLRFDFTGLGDSAGDFSNTNFSSNLEDLRAAYEALKNKYEAPQILIGHSLGGAAVLRIAEEFENVQVVATIAAPSNLSHVLNLFKDDMITIESKGEAQVTLGGREFNIKRQFIKDLSETDFLSQIKENRTKKSYLIFHSPTDEIVSIDHAAKIYMALKHPKSFISLENADHLVSNPADSEFIGNIVSAWVSRYIEANAASHIEADSEEILDEEVDVRVRSRTGHKFTQDIHTKDHHILADEPLTAKGDNLGMNPYELLLSSLGACTAMTVKMYADLKGIKLESVKVDLSHEKKYVEDCRDCTEKPVKLDHINKKITFIGNITDEEKNKLLSIAERCPVNRTLQSEIKIE